MEYSQFRGMSAKMKDLMRSAQAGRIVHALLFTGPHGTGKRSMAELFARAVLCTGENRPCGVCPACKKCLDGLHPDVHFLEPDKNSIKVDPVRELIDSMRMTSYEGGKKIAIIERADLMTEAAQNALLKTLESPVGDAMFFLLTDAPGALLPTIVSRCLTVRFQCIDEAECAQALIERGIEPARARMLAEMAQGSVGRAIEMDADEDYLSLRTRVLEAMRAIRKPADIADAVAKIGSVKEREESVLEILEQWAVKIMRAQNGAGSADSVNIADADYNGSILLQSVIRAREQLKANLSWANVFEPMLFELLKSRESTGGNEWRQS